MLLVDTREKWTQEGSKDRHLSGYFARHKIPYRVQKLDVGDYMLDGGIATIDRKQNVEEICKNLTNPADKQRFFAEARRAMDQGLRLIVLIESNRYRQIVDLKTWRSKYSRVPGTVLCRQMERLRFAYGVQFRFCAKNSAGRRIVEILREEQREYELRRRNSGQGSSL